MSKFVLRVLAIAFILSPVMLIVTSISTAITSSIIPSPPVRREDRFGVYHWNPALPSPTPADRLNWGAQLAYSTGTKTIRVELGYDQDNSYGFDPLPSPDDPNFLVSFAAAYHTPTNPYPYDTLFRDPNISTYLLTVYTYHGYHRCWGIQGSKPGICNGPAQGDNPNDYYTASEANLEFLQIQKLGTYLLAYYPTKTFIILNWEGDGDLQLSECAEFGGTGPADRQDDYRKFIQARSDGIREAVRLNGGNGKLYSAVEISCLRQEGNFDCSNFGSECARGAYLYNNILKLLDVDYISYSSWQTSAAASFNDTSQGSPEALKERIITDVNSIVTKANEGRATPKYTTANIILGEFGYDRNWTMSAIDYYQAVFDASEALGVSHVIYWQAVDNPSPDLTNYGLYTLNNTQVGRTYTGNVFTNLLSAKTFVASFSSWGTERLDMFFREGYDKSIRHIAYYNGAWGGIENLGGVATSDPAAVSWGTGRIDVFVKKENNEIFQKTYASNFWGNWSSIGQPYAGSGIGSPIVTTWGQGRLDVFVRASDGVTWHKAYDTNAWGNWENLGGVATSEPAAVSWGTGRVDVFVRGTDGGIHQKSYNSSSWQNWVALGEPYMGSGIGIPTVTTWGQGRLDVFVRASDGVTWHKAYDTNAWGNWENLGGVATSAPAAVSWGTGRVDVFVRGTDKKIYHNSYTTGGAWAGWGSIGEPYTGSGIGSPIVTTWGQGRLDVFVQANAGSISQNTYTNNAWGSWGTRYCSGSLDMMSHDLTAAGGSKTVYVRANPNCIWGATSNVPWITITSAFPGVQNGSVSYTVAPNPSQISRTGTITIAEQTFTVIQAGTSLQFYPLPHPVRLLDTRVGFSGCDAPGAKITGNTSRTQTAAGRTCEGSTIPSNAAALVGSATVVQPTTGTMTLYPSDAPQPLLVNTYYEAPLNRNTMFTVRLGVNDGAFNIFVSSDTDVVIDVTGYYAPPSVNGLYFHPLPKPVRLLDTRAGQTACFAPGTQLAADSTTTVLGTTTCDGVVIPLGAQALAGNATTTNVLENGFLTLYPSSDAEKPLIASANYQQGINLNSPFAVGLSPSGQFKIYVSKTIDLVVDVTGYYSTQLNDVNGQGLLFNVLTNPTRLLDTRTGQLACDMPGGGSLSGVEYTQKAIGACSAVPSTARGIIGTAATLNEVNNGFLTFWPSNVIQRPVIATSNYRLAISFSRHFIVALGDNDAMIKGAIKRYTSAQTDLVIDITGYFAP